jgi:hypothetical protein
VKTGAADTITFRLGHITTVPAGGGVASATGPTAMLAAAGTFSIPARVPVATGDTVGFDFATATGSHAFPDPLSAGCFNGGFAFFYNPHLVDGAAPQAPQNGTNSCELLVNATVEPDADNDGYGDETQDQCPTDASTHGPCPTGTTTTPTTTTPTTTTPPPPPPCAGKTGLALKRCLCKQRSTKAKRKKCLSKVNAAARKD